MFGELEPNPKHNAVLDLASRMRVESYDSLQKCRLNFYLFSRSLNIDATKS